MKPLLKPYIKHEDACDLIDKLLLLDPLARIDADRALDHNFFWTEPMPADLSKMLSHHSQSMFEFLALPRRRAPMVRGYELSKEPHDNGYQDHIYWSHWPYTIWPAVFVNWMHDLRSFRNFNFSFV